MSPRPSSFCLLHYRNIKAFHRSRCHVTIECSPSLCKLTLIPSPECDLPRGGCQSLACCYRELLGCTLYQKIIEHTVVCHHEVGRVHAKGDALRASITRATAQGRNKGGQQGVEIVTVCTKLHLRRFPALLTHTAASELTAVRAASNTSLQIIRAYVRPF